MMKINYCDIYILVWVLYYLQGIIIPVGGFVSISLLALNLMVSVFFAFKVCHDSYKPLYFYGLTILLVLFSIYGFLEILLNSVSIHYTLSGKTLPSFNYIKNIYISLLPIFPFYYFSLNGYLSKKRLMFWVLVFFASCTCSFFYEKQKDLNALMEIGSLREEVTNNAGYIFLSLLPSMVLFKKKPLIQFLGIVYIMFFIIDGMKRGAILLGCITSLYIMVSAIIYESRELRRRRFLYLFMLVALVICYASYQMQTSEYALYRFLETMSGNSSGRDDLYSFFLNHFLHSTNGLQFLFGRGANGTLEIYTNYAHNDWLEIAINEGLLGICVYLVYWMCFYRTIKRTAYPEAKECMIVLGIILFSKTIFSMSYSDMSFISTSLLGFALAYGSSDSTITINTEGL